MAVSRRALFGKLDLTLFRAIESATAFAKLRGNPYVELTHWLHQLWQLNDSDLHRICRHYQIEPQGIERDLASALTVLPSGASSLSDFSHHIGAAVERAWIVASLEFGDRSIRSAWLLVALLQTPELRSVLLGISPAFRRIPTDALVESATAIIAGSPEEREGAHDGSGLASAMAEDASIEDFTHVFAAGGAADEFFTTYLAPFVDMSVRPWRYKHPDMANAMVGAEGAANGTAPQPATTGPTLLGETLKLLAHSGPNLDAFYRARQIRDVFFRDAAGKKFGWKLDLKVMELDPTITDLIVDIDGQGMRYVHGPVQAFAVTWPGPRGGATAELTANPRISSQTSTMLTQGPWALFRLLDKGRIVGTATPARVSAEFEFDGRKALLDINTGSQSNPLNSDLLRGFRCPGRFS